MFGYWLFIVVVVIALCLVGMFVGLLCDCCCFWCLLDLVACFVCCLLLDALVNSSVTILL